MSGNNRTGRTRRMVKSSFDEVVGSVETPFTERFLTIGEWLLTSGFFGGDICLFECNLGAIEISVFAERRSAFFFDSGSRPAGKV